MNLREMTTGEAEAFRAGWEAAINRLHGVLAELKAEYREDGFPRDAETIANIMDTVRATRPPA